MQSLFKQLTNLDRSEAPLGTEHLGVQLIDAELGRAELNVYDDRHLDSQHVVLTVDKQTIVGACSCQQKDQTKACSHVFRALEHLDWGRFPWPSGDLTFQKDKNSGWKLALSTVEQDLRRRKVRDAAPNEQYSYVIDLPETIENGDLTIHVAASKLHANGFSAARFSRFSSEGPTLAPEDEKAIDLLEQLGSCSFNDEFVVTQLAIPTVLRSLSETGRLYWSLDLTNSDWEEITWSEQVWEPRISVAGNRARWTLSGDFHCDGETRPVSEAVLVLSEGIVLFPDSVATYSHAADAYSWILALRNHGNIRVPRKATSELMDKLAGNFDGLKLFDLPEELQYEHVVGVPTPRLRVAKAKKGSRLLTLEADFLYEGQPVSSKSGIVNHEQRQFIARDKEREATQLEELEQLDIKGRNDRLSGRRELQLPPQDLPTVVAALSATGWIVEADGKLLRRSSEIHIDVKSGVDWFDLDGQFDYDGHSVSFPKVLSAMRRGDSFVTLDDGTQGLLPEEWLEKFADLAHLGEADGDALRFTMPQAALLDALLDAQENNVRLDNTYLQYREKLRSFSGVDAIEPHKNFQGELRDYQKEGLGWIEFLREFGLGGCLADDMGLGKTIQVLATLQAERKKRATKKNPRLPSLIVVPRSLLFNWEAEAEQFTPDLKVMQYFGNQRETLREAWDEYDIIITTYGIVRRDIEHFMEQPFHYVVLDEAQAIKNNSSQAAKACRLLQGRHRLALTGTPVENHLGELWSLFEFLNPGLLGRNDVFMGLARRASEEPAAAEMISQGIRPFVLRRTKQEVLTDLPQKTEQTIVCDLDPKQRTAYKELRDYYRQLLSKKVDEQGLSRSKIHVLEALLRLRQCACHPKLLDPDSKIPSAKLNALFDNLDNIIADGHKALVFSQFTKLLAVVRQELDSRDIPYEYLDGRTRQREERVKAFQDNPDCPLFLISLKAGGHGLNLTAADYVFILDPWWNPAVEAQAVDRAHRIGQDKAVFAYRLICKDTVEEKIVELQKKKRDLADAIINADNSLMRNLTAEDLAVLLS